MRCAWGRAAAYQKAVREQKLAAEISAAKRERDFYLSRVDRAKGAAAQAERKRKVCRSDSPMMQPATKRHVYFHAASVGFLPGICGLACA